MVVGFSCAMISLLTQNTICCSTHTAALHVNYNSLTLRYCFVFNFDHIKTFCLVQKQLHKCSEYQFAAKIWKKVKVTTDGIRTGVLSLKGSELNQKTTWTVVSCGFVF